MKRNSLIVIYLALSVLCLRVVGLHLHVHHHVAPHAATESEGVHLASDIEHDSSHQQDTDVLESGLVKKPGQSWEPKILWAGAMALVLTLFWRPVRHRSRRQHEVYVSLLRYFLPPSLAPPHPAS